MKKTFKDFYEEAVSQPTPAQQWIAMIAEATLRKESTVRMWLSNCQRPSDMVIRRIAEVLQTNPDDLFPEEV